MSPSESPGPRQAPPVLFTIITPSFNCGEFLEANIRSVRAQHGPDTPLEHWVIDGGSTDGTVACLGAQKDVLWISEPDWGLSDAVNKGIRRARGDWIVWLNADDFLDPNALATLASHIRSCPAARMFCGSLTVMGYDGCVENIVPGWDYKLGDLLGSRTAINQSATIVHREVYESVGLLDVTERFAMDYEWLVRAMHHYTCVVIPENLTFYRRRRGSITDAHMADQVRTFLWIRRKYRRPFLSRAELRMRFYLLTEPLRRVRWFRSLIRRIKMGLRGKRN